MALIEHDLFRGRIDKVAMAVERMKAFEPPEGYYLAYSGGKDSDTILALAKMAKVKFDAHYHLTTVDPPELVYHVRRHPEVEIDRSEMTMWQLIVKKCMPPTRMKRYCCEYLKERGGSGRIIMTGVRREESAKRARRNMNEACFKDKTKRYFHPIIDWTSKDVWQFLRENKISYCNLYDKGFKRIGCVMCPYSNIKRQAELFPKIAQAYKRAIIRCWDKKNSDIEGGFSKVVTKFKDGEDMYNWWISGRSAKEWAEKDTEFWAYE
jgi:phosphoadenosine phosphosulfate reductase